MGNCLEFREREGKGNEDEFQVIIKNSGYPMGIILWDETFNRYTYSNWYNASLYDSNCLKEIAEFLDKISKKHKKTKLR